MLKPTTRYLTCPCYTHSGLGLWTWICQCSLAFSVFVQLGRLFCAWMKAISLPCRCCPSSPGSFRRSDSLGDSFLYYILRNLNKTSFRSKCKITILLWNCFGPVALAMRDFQHRNIGKINKITLLNLIYISVLWCKLETVIYSFPFFN